MSKFVACEDQFKAKAWAHVQALQQGERRNLYPKGFRFSEDGAIEMPDEAVTALKLKAGERVLNTVEQARANKLTRPQPIKRPTKPIGKLKGLFR